MRYIALFLLFLYLLFVSLGSAPLDIYDVKIVNFISMSLLFFVVFLIPSSRLIRMDGLERLFYAILFLYLILSFLSVILSFDVYYSTSRYFVLSGYAVIAIGSPLWLSGYVNVVGKMAVVSSVISSTILWLAYIFIGPSHWAGRMTVPTWTGNGFSYFPEGWGSSADPNVLGFGLMLVGLFGLAFVQGLWRSSFFIFFVFSASLLTQSRTMVLSLFLSVIIASFIFLVFFGGLKKGVLGESKLSIPYIFFLISSFSCVAFFLPFADLLSRFQAGDSRRIELLQRVFSNWVNSESIYFGVGTNMARIMTDPHNIYVTALHDYGVVGFSVFSLFIVLLIGLGLTIKDVKARFFALLIIFYMVIGGMTYWHSKVFWVAVMFVLFLRRMNYSKGITKGLNYGC